MIEGTYKGLAMALHGFTGAVAKKYFSTKQTMFVQPITAMQFQISSTLQADDYIVKGFSHEKALAHSKESLGEGLGYRMPLNSIKITALDRVYRTHASN